MRRFRGNMNGEQYCGDVRTKEIHDLDQENSSCHIDKIIADGYDKPFNSILLAHNQQYMNCRWCLPSR